LINADEVARYLKENPAFFDEYSEMLSQISVPHPHGGNAIPLSDRQVLALRDKNKVLEAKLAELIQYGEENDAIGEKMHRLALALLAAQDLSLMLSALYYNLREDFAVPHVAMRVWQGAGGERPEFSPVSEDLKQYAAGLAHPYCGPSGNAEAAGWFGESTPHLRSMALMPLAPVGSGADACFGMLALASEDAMRFYPEMGTLYLKRLGELVSASLGRFA